MLIKYPVSFEQGWGWSEYKSERATVIIANAQKSGDFEPQSLLREDVGLEQYIFRIADGMTEQELLQYGDIEKVKINSIDFTKQDMVLPNTGMSAVNYFTLMDGHLYSVIFEFYIKSVGNQLPRFKDESVKIINTFEFVQ